MSLQENLTRPIGPLPVWGWLVGIGAGFFVVPRLFGGGGTPTTTAELDLDAVSSGGVVFKPDPDTERSLKEAQDEQARSQEEIANLNDAIQELERAKRDADAATRQQIEAQQQQLRQERSQYEARIRQSAARETQLKNEINRQRQEFQRREAELKRQLTQLRRDRDQLLTQSRAAREAQQRAEQQRNANQSTIERLQRTIASLQAQLGGQQPPSSPAPAPRQPSGGGRGPGNVSTGCDGVSGPNRPLPANERSEFTQRNRLGVAMYGVGQWPGRGGYNDDPAGYAKTNQLRRRNGLRALDESTMRRMYQEAGGIIQRGPVTSGSAITSMYQRYNVPYRCTGGGIVPSFSDQQLRRDENMRR